jgi:hypothetical protein
MKACYLLGFDIETGGPKPLIHPLLAVGFSIFRWNGKDLDGLKLIDTLEVHIEAPVETYDEDTLQFWKKNPEAWDIVRKDTISEADAADKLITFLKKYQGQALNEERPFRIVTDNCWFDDTILSTFLTQHGGNPMRYNYCTGYTKVDSVIDVNQHIQAYTAYMNGKLIPFQSSVPHDHTPVHDSMGIVEKYVNYVMSTATLRSRR